MNDQRMETAVRIPPARPSPIRGYTLIESREDDATGRKPGRAVESWTTVRWPFSRPDHDRSREITAVYGIISPRTWGLSRCERPLPGLAEYGLDRDDLENRCFQNTYRWLLNTYDEESGAFFGHYDARTDSFAPPQNVNLIAPWQLIAAYDRYGDAELLAKAVRASDWVEENLVESHPMSLVCGGVRDNIKRTEVWVKYAADYVTLNVGLWERTREERFLRRAFQSAQFILQAEYNDFATRYDDWVQEWSTLGWQSLGRVIECFFMLAQATGERCWIEHAENWGRYGLTLIAPNGCMYLIRNAYYNSDLAADVLRGFTFLYEELGATEFLYGARAFADWHVRTQRADGAWPLTIDRQGNVVANYVGPGDPPNIAIALLRLHKVTGEPSYLDAAIRGIRYSAGRQVIPGSDHPFHDRPRTHWGLWSWDPHYDYTMSGDQSTHYVRGIYFLLDYLASLDDSVWEELLAYTRTR